MAEMFCFEWAGATHYYSPQEHRIFDSPVERSGTPTDGPREPRAYRRKVGVFSIWLNLSGTCNLACTYCFTPPTTGPNKRLMSKETAQKAVIMLASRWRESSYLDAANITFFGGEPLLNREVLEHTVNFAHEWTRETGVPFGFKMSTNATLLTDADIRFISREQIRTQVSIDGPQRLHDRHRPFVGGKGSFGPAMRNALRLLRASTAPIMVRATMAEGTYEFPEIMDFFVDQGFKSISLRPSEENNHAGNGGGEFESSRFQELVDLSVRSVLRAWKHGVWCDPYNENMDLMRVGHVKPFVCAAGCMALCVDPEGWVYPCHRFQGYDEYKLGNVRSKVDFTACQRFLPLDTKDIPECSQCWARRLCCGCCSAESVAFGLPLGRPNPSGCSARKTEALISLKLAAALGLVRRSRREAT
jgi:uncharacterized protein